MLPTMMTRLKEANLYPAAATAVGRAIATSGKTVDVHPVADGLARDFPRHSRSELTAAIITAIALHGAALRWHAPVPMAVRA